MSGSVLLVGMLISIPTYDTTVVFRKDHKLIEYISKEYKIDVGKINDLVLKVEKLTSNNFPSKIDVLSIIAIESRFKTNALNKSGAKGWMQIKYKLVHSEHENILAGIELLTNYNNKLKSERATIEAYNVGITNYKNGIRNPDYYNKYIKTKKELSKYESC